MWDESQRWMRCAALLMLFVVAIPLELPAAQKPELGVSQRIGPTGGHIVLRYAEVIIPAGALTQEVELHIKQIPPPGNTSPSSLDRIVGPLYSFAPAATFAKPVEIRLYYIGWERDELRGGVDIGARSTLLDLVQLTPMGTLVPERGEPNTTRGGLYQLPWEQYPQPYLAVMTRDWAAIRTLALPYTNNCAPASPAARQLAQQKNDEGISYWKQMKEIYVNAQKDSRWKSPTYNDPHRKRVLTNLNPHYMKIADRAIELFTEAAQLDCRYLIARTNLAATYALSLQSFKAYETLEMASRIDPRRVLAKFEFDSDYDDMRSRCQIENYDICRRFLKYVTPENAQKIIQLRNDQTVSVITSKSVSAFLQLLKPGGKLYIKRDSAEEMLAQEQRRKLMYEIDSVRLRSEVATGGTAYLKEVAGLLDQVSSIINAKKKVEVTFNKKLYWLDGFSYLNRYKGAVVVDYFEPPTCRADGDCDNDWAGVSLVYQEQSGNWYLVEIAFQYWSP